MNSQKKSLTALLIFCCVVISAQFTPGNLVVLQAGDGTAALVNTGNPIILKEYSPTGLSTYSVAVSTTLNPLLISGSATSEGGLSLSPNGKYLVFGGYAQSLPNTTALAASASSVISRGVGIVNAAGNYSRIATSSTFYSGNNIRSATSDGNDNYWGAGGNDGTDYFGNTSPAVNVQNVNVNTRNIGIQNGKLLFSTGSGTTGVYQVGTGLPVTAAQTTSIIISTVGTGTGSASTFAFYFNPSQTICYVADDRTIANGGGIQKWIFSANSWSLAYTLGTGTASTFGTRGVVADFSAPNPIVYATTSEGTANRLIAINDAGAASTATTIATATTNVLFRGLAFSPYCTAPQVSSALNNSPVCANQSLTLDVNPTGTAPFTYSWTGTGSFNSTTVKNPTVTGAATGNYSVTVSNGCGTFTAVTSVTVNPLPAITVSSATVCSGGSATLIANGANTYSWNTSSSSPTIVVSPGVTTIYTVTGTSAQGCVKTVTTSVVITGTPNITVNSATICAGGTAILIASGVTTYTWSTGSNSQSITPAPGVTTTYSVSGNIAGCAATPTNTATVVVNALPSVTLSPVAGPLCINSPTLTLGGSPAGGIFSGPGVSGNIFNPSSSGAGTFTISYNFTNANNCSNTDTKTVTVNLCTGIAEANNNGHAIIYPNPFKDELGIEFKNNSVQNDVIIYSADGKMLSATYTDQPYIIINASGYETGLYFIRLSSEKNNTLIKVLKN